MSNDYQEDVLNITLLRLYKIKIKITDSFQQRLFKFSISPLTLDFIGSVA